MDHPYRHILAAVDLDDSGDYVLQRAQRLARDCDARLSVVHVVEYLPLDSGEGLIATPVDLNPQLVQQAQQRLQALCQRHDVPAIAARVLSGPVTLEIVHAAGELHPDLVVVGHQPRRGFFAALFSHTGETLVGKAPCDVLVLRLPVPAG